MRWHRLIGLILTMVLVTVGCSSEPEGTDAEGRVTGATGASALESFVVTDTEGRSMQFVPSDDFNRTLDDLRGLVVSGEPVFVEFESGSDGARVALSLEEEWRR